MKDIRIVPLDEDGHCFVPPQYLPPGQDEHYLRYQQSRKPPGYWRRLRADEIEALVKNANTCDDWDSVLVADPFTPALVSNCRFSGLIRIGKLDRVMLEHHDLQMPAGITNSRVISCDIGDNAAIHNASYLAHYIIGDAAMLLNIHEMHVTNHAKFGSGIVKQGEEESVRVWMDVCNEVGTRAILPFDGIIPADAYIWAKYRGDASLQARLSAITQAQFDDRRGFYGTVGDGCIIKNCQIIKDVKIGPACYIKGANKLKNLTINSSADEPTQIGEGVELVNGIIGLGCHIFYGCKAVRFVMGNNCNLKYGARLVHSFMGDNSTVSCCELLNNLIFPAHEQHHNNSFLTASLTLGQSNIAAGATIGSNHNSRANDGEIRAGRGFWPGLCTTLKHNCRFASFVLLATADYPCELDVPLPFSLVCDDRTNDRLMIMPAYWWMHNMYALARNAWKFRTRDKRLTRTQNIEFDALAPDTVEEIFAAMRLLETWTAQSACKDQGTDGIPHDELAARGREVLAGKGDEPQVFATGVENSKRPVVILKARAAYAAYRQMLHYYAVNNLLAYMKANASADLQTMCRALSGPRQTRWINLGGQLAPQGDVHRLIEDIKSGKLANWNGVHAAYDTLWNQYALAKQRHAYATLLELLGTNNLDAQAWRTALDQATVTQQFVADQVYSTRKKDYDNAFRKITFADAAEMDAVMGRPEDNSFVKQVRKETQEFIALVESVKARN